MAELNTIKLNEIKLNESRLNIIKPNVCELEKEYVEDTKRSLDHIGKMMPEVDKKNPGLRSRLLDSLKWG